MTLFEIAGHPVSLAIETQDVQRFYAAARDFHGNNGYRNGDGATQAGLEAVLPGVLNRVGAQLPAYGAVVDVELPPLQYAAVQDLGEVNVRASDGWRVHTAYLDDDGVWFLLERERPALTPDGEG